MTAANKEGVARRKFLVDLDILRSPITAVILLNSPFVGQFEELLLHSLLTPSSSQSRPLLVAADGAARWIHRAGLLGHLCMACGDMDSIGTDEASASIRRAARVSKRYDTITSALHHEADWSGGTASDLLDENCSWAKHVVRKNHGPVLMQIDDQNSTDFDKCLAVTEQMLRRLSLTAASRHRVAVLGAFGDRWDHWFASIHSMTAFAQASSNLELLLVHERNTLSFCVPNASTTFLPQKEFRGFSVIPFGAPPSAIRTSGLQWNISVGGDDDATRLKPVFGFAVKQTATGGSALRRSFISTSNELETDSKEVSVMLGRQEEDQTADEPCAVAVVSFPNHRLSSNL